MAVLHTRVGTEGKRVGEERTGEEEGGLGEATSNNVCAGGSSNVQCAMWWPKQCACACMRT